MPTRKTTASILAFLAITVLFQSRSLLFDDALAQEPPEPEPALARYDAPPLELRCRVFPVLLDGDSTFETGDATTEVGQWIEAQDGWLFHSADFEVGQKSTGFPQGFSQVCLRKVE